jgi:hypothetical protein
MAASVHAQLCVRWPTPGIQPLLQDAAVKWHLSRRPWLTRALLTVAMLPTG